MKEQLSWSIDRHSDPVLYREIALKEDTKQLFLQVQYPKEFEYGSFLVIFDSNGQMRLQKLLGYGEQKIGIGTSPQNTTVGGVPGILPKGIYRIALGIFTEYLERYEGTLPVTVQITIDTDSTDPSLTQSIGTSCWIDDLTDGKMVFNRYDRKKIYNEQTRWYKGDFHTHTRLSDGKQTVEDAMKLAKEMQMDFYVPTEHNLVHTGWIDTPVMPVPSVEITTGLGHCNLFGITQYPGYITAIMEHVNQPDLEDYLLMQIQEAKEKGWLVSINHPFLHIWKWKCKKIALEDISCMEIVNDPTYQYAKEANDETIDFLDLLHKDGYCITGVGGSDAHNLPDEYYPGADEHSVAGDPATFVYAEGLSPEKLLSNVKKGHVCVTRHCNISFQAKGKWKEYLPGDHIEEETISIRIQVTNAKTPAELYAVSYRDGVLGEQIQKVKVPGGKKQGDTYSWECYYSVMGSGWQWLRFEVRDSDGNFMAYTNPLYYGTKEHRFIQFSDALEEMEQTDVDKRNPV